MQSNNLIRSTLSFTLGFLLSGWTALAAEPKSAAPLPLGDVSFKNEIQHAVDRGLAWLQANQNSNGWWSTPDHPAVTSLALMAFKGAPGQAFSRGEPAWLKRGYEYLVSCVKPDGGIHRDQLVTYNTALGMMAL